MEILGVGPMELFFVFLLALILMGPKKLGEAGTTIGKWLNNFVKSDTWMVLRDISDTIFHLPTRLMREANLEDLERELQLDPNAQLQPGGRSATTRRPHRRAPEAGEAAVDNIILPPERSQTYTSAPPPRPAAAKKKPAAKKSKPAKSSPAKVKPKTKKRADA